MLNGIFAQCNHNVLFRIDVKVAVVEMGDTQESAVGILMKLKVNPNIALAIRILH